jgi:hypothetical protein
MTRTAGSIPEVRRHREKQRKANMSIRKLFLTSMAIAAAALPALAQTSSTTRTIHFPPAGLGSTETAQINVVNLASNSSSGTAASCTGTITFLNSSGAAIGSATTFTVTTGDISSVSLPFSKAGITGARGEIRGVIDLTLSSGVPCAPGFSFETFDTSTGVTHIFLGNPGGGPGFGPGGPGPGH